jgi:hypothetical protein
MFTGLKRSLLIIVAMLTVVPWGMMQMVLSASVKRLQHLAQGPDQLVDLGPGNDERRA